jgi:hypothetical protein
MANRVIDPIVDSLTAGDMSVDEFMSAVEERILMLCPTASPDQEVASNPG